jgi:hypothetical protein
VRADTQAERSVRAKSGKQREIAVMTRVISGHIEVESDPGQQYVSRLIDGSDDFPDMMIQVAGRVRRDGGVVGRHAIRDNDENPSSSVPMSQAAGCPGGLWNAASRSGPNSAASSSPRMRRSNSVVQAR